MLQYKYNEIKRLVVKKMNSSEKFEEIYSQILENNADELEFARTEAQKQIIRNWIAIPIVLGVIGIIMYFILDIILYNKLYTDNKAVAVILDMYIVIFLIVCVLIKFNKEKSKLSEFKDKFKTKVIKALLDSFDENIEYLPHKGISSIIYNEAEFEKYDTYSSEDLMQGTLKNNCNFSMAEVLTEYETTDSDENKHYHTLFYGILSKVETPKPFNASLYLRKDIKDKNILSRAFRAKLPFDNLRVELDSQEFEKYFDVYCSNKIIAMQLLTADVMQLLIEFQKEMNMEYELTIKNSHLYIRFMSGEMFEAACIAKFSLDKATLYRYYRMLDFTFTLTAKLTKLIKDTEYQD
jgi:phosphate/sulfate permease